MKPDLSIIKGIYAIGFAAIIAQALTSVMTYTLVIMVAGLVILELFAKPFSTIFGLSGATATLCVSAIRIVSLSYLFAGANIAYQGIFQALDSGLESLIISICRQFLFVIPVAWVLAKLVISNAFPTWSLWLTFLIAEGLSTLIAFVFMEKVERKKINSLA